VGSEAVVDACKKRLGIGLGETTPDGKFTLVEVECLGACVNAPMAQINDDYYEDLTPENTVALLDALADGRPVKTGSQTGRHGSQAASGPTSLHDMARAAGVES
jgi:NADH-quinone oxidoreductase subunit E